MHHRPVHWLANHSLIKWGLSSFSWCVPSDAAARNTYAKQLCQAMVTNGYQQQLDWLESLLSASTTFSARHGIAEVVNDSFRCAYDFNDTVQRQWSFSDASKSPNHVIKDNKPSIIATVEVC